MKELKKGEFFGSHYKKSLYKDCIITDTEYTHKKVDWHYHENPYFTYLIQGKLFEANKKESYYLKPGSLLFHNWQDAHYNIKPDEYTRGFHIELQEDWFTKYDIKSCKTEGSNHLENPIVKSLVNKIFLESKTNDTFTKTSIDSLLISIFETINTSSKPTNKKPKWLAKLNEILVENTTNLSLTALSSHLQIHPVHLSREFSKHYNTTLGQYIRHVKLNKALLLIATNKLSLTEICYECNFYDQSHFIKTFKNHYGFTPLKALKKIV